MVQIPTSAEDEVFFSARMLFHLAHGVASSKFRGIVAGPSRNLPFQQRVTNLSV